MKCYGLYITKSIQCYHEEELAFVKSRNSPLKNAQYVKLKLVEK